MKHPIETAQPSLNKQITGPNHSSGVVNISIKRFGALPSRVSLKQHEKYTISLNVHKRVISVLKLHSQG